MKKVLKNAKGITLVSLTVTVIVILILTGAMIYNIQNSSEVESLKAMQNDIENLRDKIAVYYAKNEDIPAKIKYTNLTNLEEAGVISSAVDVGDFYVIDLSALDNLTLNNGADYEKIQEGMTQQQIDEYKDVYIINKASHNIFYIKGVEINKEFHYTTYTKENVDQVAVKLRYVDNVKIPDGYLYVRGNVESGLIICDMNDNSKEYIWVVVKEQMKEVPNNIQENDADAFLESVKHYQGYFKSTVDNTALYTQIGKMWGPIYDKEEIYKDKYGDTASIPKGFRVSQLETENKIQNGLVVVDSNENEFVWIAVPKQITTNSNTPEEIYEALNNYAKDYREDTFEDTWFQGCGLTQEEYNNNKTKMLNNIKEKGGFWIGRYEAGIKNVRADEALPLQEAHTKQDLYPYHYITPEQSQTKAKEMVQHEAYKGSLMYGIQWDLTLKFIEERGNKTKSELIENSTTWGNFPDSAFQVKRGAYSSNDGRTYLPITEYEKASGTGVLLTTGAVPNVNVAQNIYDLAGNVLEITLEKNERNEATGRGGAYDVAAAGNQYINAVTRLNLSSTTASVYYTFRVTLI